MAFQVTANISTGFSISFPPPSVFKQATVNSLLVPATQTNFPALVDLSRIGITTLAEARSVRVYADSAKTTELAREIVSAVEMHVKIPSLTNTVTIYVDYDGTRSDYAVTDTYGRNAVWSDYYAVWHFQGAAASADKVADSTGNGRSLTEGNTPASITGRFGDSNGGYDMRGVAADVNSSTGRDWLERASGILTDIGSSSFTMQGWHYPDITPTNATHLIQIETNSATGRPYAAVYRLGNNDGVAGVETSTTGSNDTPAITSVFANSVWHFFAFGRNASNFPFGYINGTLTTSSTAESGSFSAATAPFYINRRNNTSYPNAQRYGDGKYDEVRIRFSHLSENWLDTEYNNQGDEASFWGTWTTVSTGTTYTQTLDEVISIIDNFRRQPSRFANEVITIVDTLRRSTFRSLSEVVTLVDRLSRNTGRALFEVVTVVDTVRARIAAKILNEAVTIVDRINRSINRALSEMVTVVDRLNRTTGRLLNEVLSLVDTVAVTKVTARAYSEVVTLIDTVLVKITSRMFTEIVAIVDRLNRTPSRAFQETVSVIDRFTKNISKLFLESISVVDLVRRSVSRAFVETVNVVDTLTRQMSRTFFEVVTVVDTVAAIIQGAITLVLSETVTVVDTLRRSTGRLFFEAVTVADTLVRTTGRRLAEAITVVDTFSRSVAFTKSLNEIVTIVDSVRARISAKILTEAILVTDTVSRSISRFFREAVLVTDILSFLKAARGFIRGRDNDTGIGIGKRNGVYLGRDNDTGIGIGRRNQHQVGRDNDTNTGIGKKLN